MITGITLTSLIRLHIHPADATYLYNICATSAQRLRRWSNIVQMLYKCFVFAGHTIQHCCACLFTASDPLIG